MLAPLAIAAAFSLAECSEILRMAEAEDFREAGLVRGRQNESIRTARTVWLDESGEAAWLFERVMRTVLDANRSHFGFNLTEFAERMQVARYDAAEAGHFDWHVDMGEGSFAARRKLTMVVQLSEPESYAGGALELNANGQPREAEREIGTAILFPSFVLHRVTPVTRGLRHSLTCWVHGPDFA